MALVLVLLTKKIYPNKDHSIWRIGLIIAAVIYPVFVLISGQLQHMPMEIGGVILYGTFALLSKKYTLHWLVAGWALHICWDLFLHSADATPYVPAGYAMACLGFDIAIAGYLAWVILQMRSKNSLM